MNEPQQDRVFAVVPAAGHSRRMGRDKLLLTIQGRTVIGRLLEALRAAGVAETVVVIRPNDEPLAQAVAAAGASLVRPEQEPPDMRASVELGLAAVRERFTPTAQDAWLLVPADHPILDADQLRAILKAWVNSEASILVPTHAGRRGHPTVFRWSLAAAVARLPKDCGVNALVRDSDDVLEFPCESDAVLLDLDTPDDVERLNSRLSG
jgi:molybdenum cofactor cytidylyltransferase